MDDVSKLEQTCTLRAQLGALLTQTLHAENAITNRIAELENEIRVQRMRLDQTAPAIRSLQQTIQTVDDAIRRQRDVIYGAASRTQPVQAEAKTPALPADAGQKQRSRR